ncbi:MAG: hypothetical protein EOP06_25645, partial [Proteobacteria bacterium]
KDASLPSANSESGFGVEDGALYFTYEKEGATFYLDLPFRRQKSLDLGATTDKEVSNNGNIQFGNDKAQAYIKYSPFDKFTATFGQFDTIYGVELNDSKDRVFGKTGIVYDTMLPVTHAGVQLQLDVGAGYIKALAANSANKGTLGNSATGDNSYEYGGAIGYGSPAFRAQVGYLQRPINKADGSGNGNRGLIDVTLGTTLGIFTLDLEYLDLRDANKNQLTATNTDVEKNGMGLLLLTTVALGDHWVAGLRVEQVKYDPGAIGYDGQSSAGFSLHYKVNAALELRAEQIAYNNRLVGATEWLQDHRTIVSTLFVF